MLRRQGWVSGQARPRSGREKTGWRTDCGPFFPSLWSSGPHWAGGCVDNLDLALNGLITLLCLWLFLLPLVSSLTLWLREAS